MRVERKNYTIVVRDESGNHRTLEVCAENETDARRRAGIHGTIISVRRGWRR